MAKKKVSKPAKFESEIEDFEEPQETNVKESKSGGGGGVYRVTEIIGTSPKSWEDAVKKAIETAGKTLRSLRVAEVGKLDVKVVDGKVVAYRARVTLSFKFER